MADKFRNVIDNLTKIQKIICIIASVALLGVALFLFTPKYNPKEYNVNYAAAQHKSEDGVQKIQIRGISLPRGSYDIHVGYTASADADVEISLGNTAYKHDEMPEIKDVGTGRTYHFDLIEGTDRGRIDFSYPMGAELQFAYITIDSDTIIYNDGIIWGIMLILMIPGIWLAFYFFNHSTHKASLVITIIAVAVQIIPFIIQNGMHIGVDSQTHMMRIEGIYYGLMDGQFPVVVYPEWNNSYGQIGVLYPNVFLYVPAIFRLLGMSQLGVCKLFVFLVIITSALIALASARTIFKRDWHINLCVIALTLEDIRLWDMLYRGRIQGSFLAEMFLPLVIAGLIEIMYQNRRKWYLVAYGLAGIVCSHITTLTVTCLAVALFVILGIKKIWERKVFREIGYAILLFLGLILGTAVCFAAFFRGEYSGNLIWREFTDMLWSIKGTPDAHKWVSVFGKAAICFAALTITVYRKRINVLKGSFAVPLSICAAILTWMSTAAFPWSLFRNIGIIRYYTDMLQSGDRFLNVAAVMFSFCIPALIQGAIIEPDSNGRHSKRLSRTIAISYASIAVLSLYNLVFNEYTFFVGTTDYMYYDNVIGEIEVDSDDYLPAGTQIEWYRSDNGHISDEEAVESLAYEREGSRIHYEYTNSADGNYVELPKFYYKGYEAVDETGASIPVTKGEHNRVRIDLKTTSSPASITLNYNVPFRMTIATIISFIIWLVTPVILGIRVNRRIV